MEVRLKEKIPGVFWPVHQAIRRGEVTEVVAKGGRGSGKSSYLSMELVWQLLRHPDCHAVVLRKVGGTLRNSVYNQIVWAIGELGCAGYFRCTVSPMECTYLPTGQKILFFGTDDPGKLKSLKLPFGAVGICWFEELDQFDSPEEVRNVEQTVLRGGSWTLTLKSFNPPAMARSWANRYARETRPGSVRESMKWLQGLAAIIIDPVRCPATAAEFSEYEYERDPRTGEVLPGYPDVNNHHIDAVRYALESVWRRRGS